MLKVTTMIVDAEANQPAGNPPTSNAAELNRFELNQVQVKRILQSKAFRTSEVHRSLLTYLAEKSLAGEADGLKEYTVGLDVFQKPDSYDPRQESVVRMHMARLRQKLGEYYRTEGIDDPVIVDLPKGGFKVTFVPRPLAPEPIAVAPIITPAPPTSKRALAIMGALLAVALGSAIYFGVRLSQVEGTVEPAASAAWTEELHELWDPLLSPDRPLVVSLATQASKMTGLSNANGAFLLGQFLADRKQNVYLTGSDELTMPEITMGNVVYLGDMNSGKQLKALPVNSRLVLEATGVRNLKPDAGEQDFYQDPNKPGMIEDSYALITYAPGLNAKGGVLYLSGNHVSSVTAGVEAFTDPQLAKILVSKMRKSDGKLPRFYQILLKIRSMDDTPLEITYVLHKELQPAGQMGR